MLIRRVWVEIVLENAALTPGAVFRAKSRVSVAISTSPTMPISASKVS
jgi:hypothetical protein